MIEKEDHTCLMSGITFPVYNQDVARGYKQGLTKALEVIQDVKLKAFNPYELNRHPLLDAVEDELGALLFDRIIEK